MMQDDDLRDELVRLWGRDGVQRVERSPIHGSLPPDAIEVLRNIGVPRSVPDLSFSLKEPRSWEIVDLGGLNVQAGLEAYWPMYEEKGTAIGMDVATGEIYSVDVLGRSPPGFINSSLRQLVQFLAVSRARFEHREAHGTTGWTDDDQQMVDELRSIDERAFTDETSSWPAMFEELEADFRE